MNREELKELKNDNGLTDYDMAKAINQPVSIYRLKEQGYRDFNDIEVLAIMDVLNTQATVLF